MARARGGGRLTEDKAHAARGYSAALRWRWAEFDADALVRSIPRQWPPNTAIGWRLKTRAKVTIGGGYARERRADIWATMGDADNVVSTMLSFGAQVAAVEANGGVIQYVEAHVVSPPRGRRMVNWRVV